MNNVGGGVKEWLQGRMDTEGLSLRKAAARTDLSHGTIADILRGVCPAAETVRKLARGFVGGNGQERLALEDELLILAGHRSGRPEAEEMSPVLGQLIDLVAEFTEPQLQIVSDFAKFLAGLEDR
ncbi:hypothetical protein LCGC14_2792720 [marine sediment metagenome]|uniref:HTH cro/C1-type domain-containing protein n=1 Tax=marine sediment metagenome TaxID=412755 RepID=A0A0F9AYQ2_9ZZZZ